MSGPMMMTTDVGVETTNNQLGSTLSVNKLVVFGCIIYIYLTYLPHKAVAEVSKDKEPIGRECAEFNWFESQLMSDSNELRVKWFGCSKTKLFCNTSFRIEVLKTQYEAFLRDLLRKSSFMYQKPSISAKLPWKRTGHMTSQIQMNWESNDLVVNRFGIHMIWLSIDVCFNWFWLSFKTQVAKLKNEAFKIKKGAFLRDVIPKKKYFDTQKIKLFCETSFKIEALKLKNETFLRDFLEKWSFETQKRNISARLPSKMKLWSSKTKVFCETSFKIEALKLKNETFLRDFLEKWSFETQKQRFSARLPSKLKLWRAFLRDFLQNWSFEAQKRNIFARLPWKMKLWNSKTKHFCETSFKNEALKLSKTKLFCETSFKHDTSTRHLTPELQYVLGIRTPVTATRNDPCKVTLPWHEICNPPTDSASDASNIDIRKHEIPAPATQNASCQTLFTSTTLANVFATLTNSCACHVFCNVSKSLRLPRETHFQPPKTSRAPGVLTILTSKSFSRAGVVQILQSSTSKSAPSMPRFNDFDFQIALARRRGANFVELNFQKCSRHFFFNDFDFQIALARRRGANFFDILGSRSSATPVFRTYLCEPLKRQNITKLWKNTAFAQFLPAKISQISHLCCKTSLLSNIDAARLTGNFQYSRKLELLNFLWSDIALNMPRIISAVSAVSFRQNPQKHKVMD